MKLLKILLLFIIPLSLFANSANFAKEEIDGAFGIKLGQEVKAKYYYKDSIEIKDIQGYDGFEEYWYSITPKSNLVYRISALSFKEGGCGETFDLISIYLQEKYGKIEKEIANPAYADYEAFQWFSKDKNRRIRLACSDKSKLLGLYYDDYNLTDKAEKEKQEIELNKIKQLGL